MNTAPNAYFQSVYRRLLALALVGSIVFFSACADNETVRIGVLLPLSGEMDLGWREPLLLARQAVNRAGGINGRPLEYVWADTSRGDAEALANRLAKDDSIAAVIGPSSSTEAFAFAPLFIQQRKPLISPSATSADLFRAFSNKRYFWRTVESDIAQVRTMLLIALDSGARSVSLLAVDDAYGTTFFDWFGFFATELGLEIRAVERLSESAGDCAASMGMALTAEPPDVLLAAPSTLEQTICMIRAQRKAAPSTRLLLSDGGRLPALIDRLGEEAEGVEGTSPGFDPASGFATAYRELTGTEPPPYGASVYDAALLAAYGLARRAAINGDDLAQAMEQAVAGDEGEPRRWDFWGVAEAMAALSAGRLPALGGAAGPLRFDAEHFTDRAESTYSHWRVEYGAFVETAHWSTGTGSRTTDARSIFRTRASEAARQRFGSGDGFQPGPREGLWALILTASEGWSNYRHQADALAQYQLLRDNGVSDERIVMILADDLADNPLNPVSGLVRNEPSGPNLYKNAVIDYRLDEVTADDVKAILMGLADERLHTVVDSGPGDDVYVFLVGHGDSQGLHLGQTQAEIQQDESTSTITPEDVADIARNMAKANRFRRLLWVVETCHGGVLGSQLDTPGAVLLAGANPFENSFGANYDSELRAWLANQFAYEFWSASVKTPDITLDELYGALYLRVNGSHVSLYNAERFGDLREAPVGDFLRP